jgi:hypothetical protein
MKTQRYCMSFTTGGLFLHESVKLAELFLELATWPAVRLQVLAANLLQARTQSSAKRVCREIIARLETLAPAEIELLAQGNRQEQLALLWIAVCRRYQFIADFAVEIVRERYLSLKIDLPDEDFQAFFNRKADWHAELEAIRPTTRTKLRQVLFKMLREAEILGANNSIQAAILSPRLLAVMPRRNRGDVVFFPALDADIGGGA